MSSSSRFDKLEAPSLPRGPQSSVLVGRSHADAPEIDGVVYVSPNEGSGRLGEFAEVRITGSSEYDLFATLAE